MAKGGDKMSFWRFKNICMRFTAAIYTKSLSENQDVAKLQAKIVELELQNDSLMQVNTLLKKEQGIDQLNLSNRESSGD